MVWSLCSTLPEGGRKRGPTDSNPSASGSGLDSAKGSRQNRKGENATLRAFNALWAFRIVMKSLHIVLGICFCLTSACAQSVFPFVDLHHLTSGGQNFTSDFETFPISYNDVGDAVFLSYFPFPLCSLTAGSDPRSGGPLAAASAR